MNAMKILMAVVSGVLTPLGLTDAAVTLAIDSTQTDTLAMVISASTCATHEMIEATLL